METFIKKNVVLGFGGRLKQDRQRHAGFGRLYVDIVGNAFHINKVFFKKLDKSRGCAYKNASAFENFYVCIVNKDCKRLFDGWLKDINNLGYSLDLLKAIKQNPLK